MKNIDFYDIIKLESDSLLDECKEQNMGSLETFSLIFGIVICALIGQNNAWGNIGNRSYSIWYETHFLVKKQGICKLIYFKPKHFGRYTLYEVISFFISFLFPIIFGCLAIFLCANILTSLIFNIIIISCVGLLFISQLVVVIVNDIGSYNDENKRFYLESGERAHHGDIDNVDFEINSKEKKLIKRVMELHIQIRNNSFFTVYNLWDSYYQRIKNAKTNVEKIEKINMEYIEYFSKIDKLIVVKENKDGTLVFKK